MSHIRPGQLSRSSAAALNAAALNVNALGKSGVGAGEPRVGGTDGSYLHFSDENQYFWAEIVTAGSAGSGGGSGSGWVDSDRRAYSWVDRVQIGEGRWSDGGRNGTLNAYKVEPRAGDGTAVAVGTLVIMRESTTLSGMFEFMPFITAAGSGSGSGSGSGAGDGEVLIGSVQDDIYCVSGVIQVWKKNLYQSVSSRDVRFGEPYFSHTSGCCECGSGSGSGSGSGGGGAIDDCGCAGQTVGTWRATLSGGEGTMDLTWDGSTYWQGSKALGCGETLHLRRNVTGCGLEYCCDGATWVTTPATGLSTSCGPPVVETATWACDMDSVFAGCAPGSCGTINVTQMAEV